MSIDDAAQIIMLAHQPAASREQRLAASELFTQVAKLQLIICPD